MGFLVHALAQSCLGKCPTVSAEHWIIFILTRRNLSKLFTCSAYHVIFIAPNQLGAWAICARSMDATFDADTFGLVSAEFAHSKLCHTIRKLSPWAETDAMGTCIELSLESECGNLCFERLVVSEWRNDAAETSACHSKTDVVGEFEVAGYLLLYFNGQGHERNRRVHQVKRV